MRYSDKPISKPSSDVLGRNSFARQVAVSIDSLEIASDGFVFSLLGEWGTGKSSVIELVCRNLEQIEALRFISENKNEELYEINNDNIEIYASLYDDVSHLLIEKEIGGSSPSLWEKSNQSAAFNTILRDTDKSEQASQYWSLLCALKPHRRTQIVKFNPWLLSGPEELSTALLSEIARSLNETDDGEIKREFAGLITRLAELGPLAGAGLNMISGGAGGAVVSASVAAAGKFAKTMVSGPTLDQLRLRLRHKLRYNFKNRILVIIDDLDRLTPKESLTMVSLVKSLGDLPNVIYLLSYDHQNLVNKLGHNDGIDGDEFLEKIIQYTIWLPTTNSDDIFSLIVTDVTTICGTISAEEQDYLQEVWLYILRHMIKTPRQARRLMNNFSVVYSVNGPEVDIADLLVLEALHVTDESVYAYIRNNIFAFTDS